jgi:hypothetical protein
MVMMNGAGNGGNWTMWGTGMWGMGSGGLLVVGVVVLGIAALVMYLFVKNRR